MPRSGGRRFLGWAGVGALAVVVAACSGGSPKVATTPSTSSPDNKPGITFHIQRPTVKASAAKTKKGKSAASAKQKSGAGASVTLGTATVTEPGSSTSNTVATATVTPGRTGTTQGGTSPDTSPPATIPGPKPYDPSKPIDLGGVPGVTPEEQARAEQLVRDTLRDLPRYADYHKAYADGFRSINDGITGTEHYVKWAYVNDGHILDSMYPESLVYQMRNGVKTLVSAMYMLPFGSRFTDAPDVGGPLTQWHVHNNLCLVDNPSDPLQKVISGFAGADGNCPPGSTKAGSSPMLHVWIVANPCGPFAPLDGIEAGEPPPGQAPLCDTAHGSG
jgi:hypothetical protein